MGIELPDRIAKNIDRFTGRAWLLPKLIEWWERTEERLFLLTGDPGTGKSMILAWLAGKGPAPPDRVAKKQLTQLRKAVKAAHFCEASSRKNSPDCLRAVLAAKPDRPAAQEIAHHDPVSVTLADRNLINADHLR